MKHRALVWYLLLFLLRVGAPEAAAEESGVSGRVVDASGAPVAGIEVATYWTIGDGRWTARNGVTTDADGAFAIEVRVQSRTRSLMALDETQEHGAVALLDEETIQEPIVLTLERTTRVHGAFESSELGYPPEKAYVSMMARPAQIAVASYMGKPDFSFRLPPADYVLRISCVDCERTSKRVTLTEDMRAVDLGTTDLEPTIIARHYGRRPPPLHVTDVRGLEEGVRLSDFEGRWVLLEFWGHW
ncbi:MAG: carboxypeptidase-like regulatory domain-containing protein [Planctomycetota bacterium]|jgi:hypothetical protein